MVRDGQQLPGRASSKYAKQHLDPYNYTNAQSLLEIARVKVFKLSSFYYFRFFPRNADLSTNVYKTVITNTQVDDPRICYFSVIYFCDYDVK